MRETIRRQWPLLVLLVALALLAGCDLGGGPTCENAFTNTSPGTTAASMTGEVILTTDHSIYSPGEPIQLTVTNHLQWEMHTVYSSCSPFGFERQDGTTWQPITACGSDTGRGDANPTNRNFEVTPGEIYRGTITADVLAPGTYRLELIYQTPQDSANRFGRPPLYSQPLRFCTCAQCS